MIKYSVSVLDGEQNIEFESLPVAKITSYPLEKRDYKPYAQVTFGMNSWQMAFNMLSFEVNPKAESKIGAVIYPFENDEFLRLEIWGTPESTDVLLTGKAGEITKINHNFHIIKGEDLQGVYWGYDIIVSVDELNEFGKLKNSPGNRMKGNFYKIQTTKPEHYGSFFDVDWENPFIYNNMIDLSLVSY